MYLCYRYNKNTKEAKPPTLCMKWYGFEQQGIGAHNHKRTQRKTKKYSHTHSHTVMEAQTNTQMPQPACHLSADRRNTPATSFQSAFHHSVTTCQLQSPSLRHTALIFTNCAAAWDTTQPCQKYDNGRITLLHLLAYSHAHVLTLRLLHTCTCVCPYLKILRAVWMMNMGFPHKALKSAIYIYMLLVKWTWAHLCCHQIELPFAFVLRLVKRSSERFCTWYQGSFLNHLSDRMTAWFIDWLTVPILHIFTLNSSHKLHSKITIQQPLTFTPLRQRTGDLGQRRLLWENGVVHVCRALCFSFVLFCVCECVCVLTAHIFQVVLSIVS